jgi:uncharacterized protein YecT (DUF1311 family)
VVYVGLGVVAILASVFAERSASDGAAERYGLKTAACTHLPDMDMQQCLSSLSAAAHAEQIGAYRSALAAASAQGRGAELRKTQASWRKFVDLQCAFEQAQFRGGTGYWSALYLCEVRSTAARIEELVDSVR